MYKSKSQMLTSMPSSIITYLHNNLLLPFPPYLSLSSLFLFSFVPSSYLFSAIYSLYPFVWATTRKHSKRTLTKRKRERERSLARTPIVMYVRIIGPRIIRETNKLIFYILHATISKPNFTFCSNLISATF